MPLLSFRESAYVKQHLREVRQITFRPGGPDVLRIHLVPPKSGLNADVPCLIVLNGQDILPIRLSWAILLSAWIDEISPTHGKELTDADWKRILSNTVRAVRGVYPRVPEETLRGDLWRIAGTLEDIAAGKAPREEIGLLSLGEYAKYMTAPHRMDLMISPMSRGGVWNCNQKCLHCYAAGQKLAGSAELSTEDWKEVLRRCRKAGIPQVTFTGGEPTLRGDLVELVDASQWFITRLNTNGVLLSAELCARLFEASLDSVQITLYSRDAQVHNRLVGAENWGKTAEGIRNALGAGLSVSVNTPLCALNEGYAETLEFLCGLGVRYVTCSGLILTGNAQEKSSAQTRLSSDALCDILGRAAPFCREHGMELNFTSPGWVEPEKLLALGLSAVPSCGACLSNMAVAPDGSVIPCQSWLSEEPLGNMLKDPWHKIWNGRRCRQIRSVSAAMEHRCQLRGAAQEGECR